MSHQSQMTRYLTNFIEGLVASGVRHAVISPGSRSTPLAILLHETAEMTTYVDVDERSAAFFALGLSKATQQPVAVVCTSGTAAANYFPAIAEANAANVPLIVLTTDRPHELRQVGAPQTMNQLNLYGDQVKEFVEMALAEETPELLNYAYWQGGKAASIATTLPKGPVHFNFPLREPLLPDLELVVEPQREITVFRGKHRLSTEQLQQLHLLWSGKKGVFVVGPDFPKAAIPLLLTLAEQLKWPVLADPLAGIRTSGQGKTILSSYYDTYLKSAKERLELQPDLVVRFGKSPVSKVLNQWLAALSGDYYLVEEASQWKDPAKKMTSQIVADPESLLQELTQMNWPISEPSWLDNWQNLDQIVEKVFSETAYLSVLSEGSVAKIIHETMSEFGNLFVSNSMPIRDLDTFVQRSEHPYTIYGNRGVNGIDGIVSTALGISAADSNAQNVLLIGDLALYHDMNGLAMCKNYQLPLTIVLINNSGGGIFSLLPQNQLDKSLFESLFGTDLALDYRHVASLYELDYLLIESQSELRQVLTKTTKRPRLIEVKTVRSDNAREHQQLFSAVEKALEQDFKWK